MKQPTDYCDIPRDEEVPTRLDQAVYLAVLWIALIGTFGFIAIWLIGIWSIYGWVVEALL